MATIVTRSGKGSPLSNTEADNNFTNLNADKAELSGAVFTGAITTNSTFDGRDVSTDGTKLDGIEASADVTDTTNVVASLSAGTGIGLSAGGAISNTAPDQTVALTGSGATSISGTYPNFTISSTNTTYSVGDGGLTQINFTSADNTKLDGIAVNANNYTLPFTDNSANWNTAYGWGNHALAGYLTAEADTLSTVLARGATSTQSITSFDTNGTQFAGLSVGEAFANYDGWNTQLNVHGGPHSRLNVKTSTVRMGVYAHNSWHNISGSTLNGHVGTYTNHGLGFLVNSSPKMVINTSGQVGINQTSPTSQLHVGGIIAATGGSSTNWNTAYTVANAALPKAGGTLTGNLNTSGSGNYVLIGGSAGSNAYSTVPATTGLMFGGGNDANNYSIGTSTQNIGGNYTKLNIKWHTGIRFFSMPQYGGTRFYSDAAMTTETFSINNLDGHVRAKNNLYANNGQLVWNVGNDGSGSGLDADLLDGINSSGFVKQLSDSSSGPNYFTPSSRRVDPNAANPTYAHYAISTFGNGGNVTGQLATHLSTGQAHTRGYNSSWSAWRTQWDSLNDGSGSGLDADLLDGYNSDNYLGKFGNSYFQANTWIQHTGAHGLYAPTINNAHFYPNTAGSYGAWRIQGSRGGYTGIYLDAGGATVIGMYDSGGNGGDYHQSSGKWSHYWHRGNTCLGINDSTTSSAYSLYVNGAIYATGNITAYSDRRVKENIRTIDNALETVEQMRGVYYNRIDDEEKKTVIGFIAQEVDEVEGAKPLVTYAEDVDQYGVSYGNTAALLVEAIKDLSQQVKDLQSEIKEMKNA